MFLGLSNPDLMVTPQLLADLAEQQESAIENRTLNGKDFNDSSFPSYSEAYKAKRAAKGRQTSPVNLKWSGAMLNSMTHKVGEGRVTISFDPGTGPRAHGHQTGRMGKTVRRSFFGVSEREGDELAETVKRHIELQA